jgi:nitrogen fixation/metabolism regulation signal transduction histidine kinase
LHVCNPAALRLLGYDDAEEILGKKIHGLIHHTRADDSIRPQEECPVFCSMRTGTDAHLIEEAFWRKKRREFSGRIQFAAHAIGDAVKGTEARGLIRIATRADGDWVEIAITDSGTGIPEEVRDKMFDPFYTTKEVGKGTGQGLALARAVVVDNHRGTLTFVTEIGKGTTFLVRLPLRTAEVKEVVLGQ